MERTCWALGPLGTICLILALSLPVCKAASIPGEVGECTIPVCPRPPPGEECKFGLESDSQGCPTCNCLDVCKDYDQCQEGEECVPERPVCIQPPCPPVVPTCVANQEEEKTCPLFSFQTGTCDEVGMGVCGSGSYCHMDPAVPSSTQSGVCCACLPRPCPPPPPEQECEFGFELDSLGCPTCSCLDVCLPRPCPPPPPEQECEFGFELDSLGCPTCSCLDVCKDYDQCKEGEECVPERAVCVQPHCPPIPTCVGNQVDHCKDVPCANGATCINHDLEFNCQCSIGYTGLFCENELVRPEIKSAQPLYGPVAGGTLVTIVLSNFNVPVHYVAFETGIHLTIIEWSDSMILVQTPAVAIKTADLSQKIVIKFENLAEQDTKFVFFYMANPKVYSVEPLVTIPIGGITLFVNGSDFQSVAYPEMNMTAVFLQGSNQESNDTYNTPCAVLSPFTLGCITPEIKLPEAIQDTPTYKDVTLYIGIILDGVPDYRNLSENTALKDYGIVAVTSDPTFDGDQSFEYNNEPIYITGANMKSCCRLVEFRILIGNSTCSDLRLTDDGIFCRPKDEDAVLSSDTGQGKQKNGTYTILVEVGTAIKVDVGIIKYPYVLPYWTYILIGIGIAIILALIVTVVVCLYKRRPAEVTGATGKGKSEDMSIDDNKLNFSEIQTSHLEEFDAKKAETSVASFKNSAFESGSEKASHDKQTPQ